MGVWRCLFAWNMEMSSPQKGITKKDISILLVIVSFSGEYRLRNTNIILNLQRLRLLLAKPVKRAECIPLKTPSWI